MTLINGILSHNNAGEKVAPKKTLFVYAEAAGQQVAYFARVVKSGNGLQVPLRTPGPGEPPSLFIITGLDLQINGKGKSTRKPFLRGPQECAPLTFSTTYVLDNSPLTAKDELVCD